MHVQVDHERCGSVERQDAWLVQTRGRLIRWHLSKLVVLQNASISYDPPRMLRMRTYPPSRSDLQCSQLYLRLFVIKRNLAKLMVGTLRRRLPIADLLILP